MADTRLFLELLPRDGLIGAISPPRMLQNLALFPPDEYDFNQDTIKLGDIHFFELCTLFLGHVDYEAVDC